jgi:hypothetical protein
VAAAAVRGVIMTDSVHLPEHDDGKTCKCSTCNSVILQKRYKCLSCDKFNLCRACYRRVFTVILRVHQLIEKFSQVHEVHPSHVFLELRDKNRTMSDPESVQGSPADIETNGEECGYFASTIES